MYLHQNLLGFFPAYDRTEKENNKNFSKISH
jgi:hypothetical protein